MRRRPAPRRDGREALAVLGLAPGADAASIVAARRRLAKAAHPDAGGTVERMQAVNDAARRALADLDDANGRADRPPSAAAPPPRRRPDPPRDGRRHDHPSFTVEALPVEAFEALLVVAGWLGSGQVADEDPPYLLEVVIDDPPAWCRLDVVPDAGSSTVSLTTARVPGHPVPDVDEVRDAWIDALNQLDWSRLDPDQPRPS